MSGTWTVEPAEELARYTVEWCEPDFQILSRRNRLYQSRSLSGPFTEIGAFPAPLWQRQAARFRPLQRLLRFMFYNTVRLNDGSLFVTFGRETGRYADGRFRSVERVGRRTRVFRGGCALGPDGGVYFGEYLPNPDRHSVHVYRFDTERGHASVVHTFPGGSVRHVHGVFLDPYTGDLWCLTGDHGKECRVVRTSDGFRTLDTVGEGDETWRAASVLFTPDAIWYATDAEFQQNHLFRIDRATGRRETVAEMEGPVYYSHAAGSDLFFAITAELCPSQRDPNASIWHVSPERRVSRLLSLPKDPLSVRHFLPGMLYFPDGPGLPDRVLVHTVALRGDDRTLVLRRGNGAAAG